MSILTIMRKRLNKIIIEEEILDEFAPTEEGKVEIKTVFK